ncbi:CDN_1a_G0016060.mRNA.1.CDS.1 [Saccharomyces cerevisiae]|nr:Bem2p [Saccharomyces cerevisiae YJM1202]AJU53604.1 Bem2p [Saccharomyces cerevisiae YJM1443]AJV34965.1 Bem2p [Saccharomyces cerevisiae YJM326]AJV36246.1 Bem2p [Saccharomyces cerevisiae YJM456]AJV37773.1 Bem2p [Saccharomyces cerevisiae YJM681]AJV38020.1 Bem2p [Saccharomyces cerevisiae YJM682]AJV38272.1 Bem2p [Saccharomyces cerevisiae YJM683]CAI4421080.1 BHH_G0016180.mRNA.1.CDS.1 [Saccharomyces cerevisiae]
MKGLLWSKNRKSSTASASSSSTSTSHKTTTASTASSSSPSSSSQTIRNSTSGASPYMHSHHHHGQGHSHHRGEDNNRDKRKSSVFPPSKQYTSTSSSQVNLGMYHSDTNTRSSRSIASTLKDDSPSVCSEDEISNSSSQKSNAQDETPIAYKKSAHSKDSLLPSRSSSLSPPQSRCSTGTTLEKSLNTSGISNSSGTNNNNSNNNNDNEQKQRNVIHLNSENYDTTVFKTGWVNKSHGQTVATNYNSSMTAPSSSSSSSSQNLRNDAYSRNRESRFYGNDGSSLKNDDSSSTTATNSGNDVASARSSMAIDPQMLVPDYRLYRAQLKGCVLNLYKSGLNSNIKFFDPTLPASNSSIANENHQQKKQQTNSQAQAEALHQKQSFGQMGEPITLDLKYLSEVYPHPDLRQDSDGKIISGTIESLCHTVLFYPGPKQSDVPNEKSLSKTHRAVINLLLMFPLLDHFIKFLKVFNQFGLSFTKNKSRLTNNSTQFYNISPAVDDSMTQRLALTAKTILDVFPGFLLDEPMLKTIISLLDTISLHNDEISNNLKIKIANKHNELMKLTAFTRSLPMATSSTHELEIILDPSHFLSLDITTLADEVHHINLKFDKVWAPKFDYSLLYDSKFINRRIVSLNPLVFNNDQNIHFLGRLLISHLFPTNPEFSKKVTPKVRAELLDKWVQIGCRFEHLGDMVSWLAVATIICSIPVLRSSSWKYVPDQSLKTIFKDWVPTIIQLERRQRTSKSTSSVFILAPPNLDDDFTRANVISYFGDLLIHADDLPSDTKFKYLEKKINRTKNAFHKWQQRLQAIDSTRHKTSSTENVRDNDSPNNVVYQLWKFHLSQPPLNIEGIMKLSVQHEPPIIDQKAYSTIGSQRSALVTGSYLPILFNELFPNYSLFPKNTLVGAASDAKLPPPRSSARLSKSLSISEPIPIASNSHTTGSLTDDAMSSKNDNNKVTGVGKIDGPVIKEMSSKQSNKQRLLKSVRDVFNIDMDVFHISDELVFKSVYDNDGKSRPASMVIETPKRFSQHSSMLINNSATPNQKTRDSLDTTGRLSKTLENMDFFNNIGQVSDSLKESIIRVVLKSSSLEKIFDLLVLTSNIFSKLVDTKDLENYYYHQRQRGHSTRGLSDDNIGLLDYAFVKLTMDNDIFTETFFNTYKSFTTTTTVLENMAKRYVGAKSCSVSISKILDRSDDSKMKINEDTNLVSSSLYDQNFPVWDMKVTDDENINLIYMAKIQIGAAEAILHLVKNHYSDFTDDLCNNSTLLDIIKIMEQEVSTEWPTRIANSKLQKSLPENFVIETENLLTTLTDLFHGIKSAYQKQLYRPIGVNRTQKRITDILNSFNTFSFTDLNNIIDDPSFSDDMIRSFQKLHSTNYEDILEWIYQLDNFISKKFNLVSKKDWIVLFQELELLSKESLVSFFNYPLHFKSSKLINPGYLQLHEFEISNLFTWISTLILKDDNGTESLFFEKLPQSIKLLIKLHTSLTTFFVMEISNVNKSSSERLTTCKVILQILNYIRWKNGSLDLFDSEEDESPHAICPHIPAFIETAIAHAIISPESRNYELSWIKASEKLSDPTKGTQNLRSISNVLEKIDDIHIKRFIEIDDVFSKNCKNLCPCPGWFISRLLEISQFVPNMSITNSKLINFDKRRFVNNIISNVLDLIPNEREFPLDIEMSDENPSKRTTFGRILFNNFEDVNKVYRKKTKKVSESEAISERFQEQGVFNEILVNEIEKIKREARKLEVLLDQEKILKNSAALHQAVPKKNRKSVIISGTHSDNDHSYNINKNTGQTPSLGSVMESNNSARNRRDSRASFSTNRSSVVSNSSHNGVSKKIGGFFRRPFSIGGFNTSSSNYSLNSILSQEVSSNKSILPSILPEVDSMQLHDLKPSYSLKTFEIKSIMEIINHRNIPAYYYAFKIVMQNGHEYLIQTASSSDLTEWIKMIKASKRFSFHSKKYKGKTHNKIFGVPLEDVCERENTLIPTIVVKLLEEIELRGLDEVGLYRIPGSIGSINALKNAFDEEGATDNSFTLEDDRWFEVNAIAGCFKMYLRELPDSLFSHAMVNDFTDLAIKYKAHAMVNEEYKRMMNELLQKLPTCYYQTLKRIVFHLNKVHQHVVNNKMDASNLAIVFSMSFINQEDLANSMGSRLGAVQTILQDFIKNPNDYFKQ